jgi:uncharacterized glyoxalase superfamily protein PhnB
MEKPMITGTHAIMYTNATDEVRASFRDVLGFASVDAGGGWLVFALPPAELAAHPAAGKALIELYLMCDDINATIDELKGRGAEVSKQVTDEGWGLLTSIKLPGGSELGLYEPRHPTVV